MSIKQNLITGVLWSAVAKYSSTLVTIVVSAILARLISPAEFGLATIATVILTFFTIFSNMGIAPAIVQRDDLSERQLDSIFTYSLILGIVLSVIVFLSSWVIADFYGKQLLIPLCQLLSINLLFTAFNIVPNALLLKNKLFKFIAIRTFFLQLVSGVLAVVVALNGGGVYALLVAPIISAVAIFAINLCKYPRRIDWKLDSAPIRSIASYSAFQFLFEFVNYFSRNLDKLIIGKYLNPAQLGYYDKSYRLMNLPLSQITAVINPVLQPNLVCLQNDRINMGRKYNRIVLFMAHVSFPIAAFLFFIAKELIVILYGDNWYQAIPSFRILALSIPLQMILSTSGAIFQASNSTKLMFWVGIRNTFFTISFLLVAAFAFSTIEAVAWSWVLSLLINFTCSYYIMYKKVFHLPISSLVNLLKMPVLNAIIFVIVLIFIGFFISSENALISLAIKSIVFGLTAYMIMKVIYHHTIVSLIKTIKE